MAKVEIVKVFAPDKFLGVDLSRKKLVDDKCEEIRCDQNITNVTDVIINKIYLAFNGVKLIRIRAFKELNPTTFNCMLIDEGIVDIIEKQNIYNLTNHWEMDRTPAAKLFKVIGVKPTEMSIKAHGPNLIANIDEGKKWTPRSYKFVCKIFENNKIVNVEYKRENNDKAFVQVNVIYKDRSRCLVDLLIEHKHGFQYEEPSIIDNDDAISVSESFSNESISKLIVEYNDFNQNNNNNNCSTSIQTPHSTESVIVNQSACFSSTKSSNSMSQSYLADLERLVKCWFVTKNKKDDKVTYSYRKHIPPILSYQTDKYITHFIKTAMTEYGSKTLLNVQAYMIPAVLRRINVLGIAPKERGKSMGILIPVLQSITAKNLNSRTAFNPIAVIICSSWQKVKTMSDSARKLLKFLPENDNKRRPKIVTCYAGDKEKRIMMTILDGCEILIITPRSLLRLLKSYEMFNFKQMEMLCLDDIEVLISSHLEYLREIMIYKQTAAIESGIEPQRIITATHWTSGLESFIKNEIGDMFSIIVNDPLEIAVFERLNQKLIVCEEVMDSFKQICSYLSLTEASLKRTIIFTTDDVQLVSLYRYLMQNTDYDLKTMKGSMTGQELKNIEDEWKQYRGFVKMPILIISDGVLGRNEISITEADSLFHLDMGKSTFSLRLNCLHAKFKELTFLTDDVGKRSDQRTCFSYIFVCPSTITSSNASFLYRFLGRCNVLRPDWLHDKAVDYILKKEISKGTNDICPRIKSFGDCELPGCDRRHLVRSEVDRPTLPNKGKIKFRILFMESPTHFHIRILEYKTLDDSDSNFKPLYMELRMKMLSYFNQQHNIHGVNLRCVKPGLIGAIRMHDLLERVMVIEDSRLKKKKVGNVYVKLIDSGEIKQIEQTELLQLSQELISIPPQAIEVYLVGVRPLDCDESFPDEAIGYAKEYLSNADLHALIVLCIGSTLWIDSVCQLLNLSMSKTVTWDKNLSIELINKEFAEKNPSHMQKLIRLCTGKVDIWKPIYKPDEDINKPIMKRFSYECQPLVFVEMPVKMDEETLNSVDCLFGRIHSPQFLTLISHANINALHRMQAEINELNAFIESVSLREIKLDDRVLYQHVTDWHRCLVLSIDHVQCRAIILALDWGYISEVSISELKKLPLEYQDMPYQAMFSSLHFCDHSANSYSKDVGDIIRNFGTDSRQQEIPLNIICHEVKNIDINIFKKFGVVLPQNHELIKSTNMCQIEVCKIVGPNVPEIALHELLIRSQSILPNIDWIHLVLPESNRPVSRMNRRGSVVHLAADILITKDYESRLRLSHTIERIVSSKVNQFNNSGLITTLVDDILNCLVILIHFVNQKSLFMSFIRSLHVLFHLTQSATLEFEGNNKGSKKYFTIEHICEIFISYHSIIHHLLRLLNIAMHTLSDSNTDNDIIIIDGDNNSEEEIVENVSVFVDVLRLLFLDHRLVEDLFIDSDWCNVLANSVKYMAKNTKNPQAFESLMELIVQLMMTRQQQNHNNSFSSTNSDSKIVLEFGGILQQVCYALSNCNNIYIWTGCLSFLGSLIHQKQYWDLYKKFGVFGILLDKLINISNSHSTSASYSTLLLTEQEEHNLDEVIDLMNKLWNFGAVSKGDKGLADKLRHTLDIISKKDSNRTMEKLAGLLAHLRIDESSSIVKEEGNEKKNVVMMPDDDADIWVSGQDPETVKKHRKCYKRLFLVDEDNDEDEYDDGDEAGDGDNELSNDSSSADENVGKSGAMSAFLNSRYNPADEDNVNCFDKA